MTKTTLIDQGRDVSRALRNRCLQIDVELRNGQDPADLCQDVASSVRRVGALVDMQDGRVIDPFHDSLKFDLFPLKFSSFHRQSTSVAPDGHALQSQVRLGKRKKPTSPNMAPVTDLFARSPLEPSNFGNSPQPNSDSYLFIYLSQIETPEEVLALYLRDDEQVDAAMVDWCLTTFDQR